MEKIELIKSINAVIKNGNRISKYNKGMVHDSSLKRLKKAKSALLFGELDAITYRDIFIIDGENEAKSYEELRSIQGASFKTIKCIRSLCICLYNENNNYKGENVRIN
jgi:hypothetical protein